MDIPDNTQVNIVYKGGDFGLECQPKLHALQIMELLIEGIAITAAANTIPGREELVSEGMVEHLAKAYGIHLQYLQDNAPTETPNTED